MLKSKKIARKGSERLLGGLINLCFVHCVITDIRDIELWLILQMYEGCCTCLGSKSCYTNYANHFLRKPCYEMKFITGVL